VPRELSILTGLDLYAMDGVVDRRTRACLKVGGLESASISLSVRVFGVVVWVV
jgi:hypothetical protein